MDVDGLRGDVMTTVPDLVEQALARHDGARTRRQRRQEIEFLCRQIDLVTPEVYLAPFRVDAQRADPERQCRRRVLADAARDGVDARQQLAKAEWLDEVVVGTEFEADDTVDLVAACADHDDRHARTGAQFAAHLVAVAIGKAQIEQHEIVLGRSDGIRRSRDPRDVEARPAQAGREGLGDRLLVLDKQYAHAEIVTEAASGLAEIGTPFAKRNTRFAFPSPALSMGGRSVDAIDRGAESNMKTIHAVFIALLLGAAAALGGFAATRTVTGTQAQAAKAPAASATFVASRSARLDHWQRQLQRALHRPLPKLPRLAHFPRVPVPAAPAPAFAAQSTAAAPAQAPRTIYVHAKAPPATHRHEHEGERERSDGGNHDD